MSEDQRAAVAAIFDRAAPTYDAVGVEFFTPVGRALVAAAALRPGDRVLDAGCGRGACLFPAAQMVGPTGHVLGIDLAPGMVEATAADVAARELAHVRVQLMDAQEPRLPADGFDAVLASLMLFFLPDPAAALTAWAVALRPEGRLAVTTFGPRDRRFDVLDEVTSPYAGENVPVRPPGTDGKGPFGSAERLAALLSEAGFSNVVSDERVQEVRFRDGEQWWTRQWSTGARHLWERVPAERQPDARRAAVDAVLAAAGEPDGSLTWRPTIRYTTAIRS